MTIDEIREKAVKESLQYKIRYSEDFELKKFIDNSDKGIQIDRLFHLLREKAYRDGYLNGYIAAEKDKAPEWHYPIRMENDKYIEDYPIADYYPIEIFAFYPDKHEYEIIKYDSSLGYYKKSGECISSRTNFTWKYL